MNQKEVKKWWTKKQIEDKDEYWKPKHREMIVRTDEADELI